MDKFRISASSPLPKPLQLFAKLTALFALASILFSYICHLLNLPNPWAWPIHSQGFGQDFTNYQDRFQYFHTTAFFHFDGPVFLYPAPLAICYHLLFSLWGYRPHSIWIFELLVAVVALSASCLFYRALRQRDISTIQSFAFCLITLAFAYPLYFDMQRGNVEIIVWATLAGALWAFRRERYILSAILIGVAIAFKVYPVILLGLFLYPRKYKAIPVALISAFCVNVGSDLWLGPDIKTAFLQTAVGMHTFVEMYAKGYMDVGYDHSFFAVFKCLFQHLALNLPVDYTRYLAIASLGAIALYFLRICKLPVINQLSILLILSITLPPVSFEYTLLHLYTCWAVFALYVLDMARLGRTIPNAGLVMGLFAFTMAPHSYIIHHGQRYCGQLHFIGLLALMYIFLRHPFAEAADRSFESSTIVEHPTRTEGIKT